MSRLADILAAKHREIEALRDGARSAPKRPTPRATIDVVHALRRPPSPASRPLRLIAEVKLKSPSAGLLSRALTPAARVLAYARSGATMASVLCDRPFFDGGWEHLASARESLDAAGLALPLLAKEFVLDESQLRAARDHGADAVLLIARIVSRARLGELGRAAIDEGLEPLVEIMDEAELESAVHMGARIIGVNTRDLDTLAMDAPRAAKVVAAIPSACVAVHLSGVKSPADVRAIANGRADAALIGEVLMRQEDPSPLLASLVEASSDA